MNIILKNICGFSAMAAISLLSACGSSTSDTNSGTSNSENQGFKAECARLANLAGSLDAALGKDGKRADEYQKVIKSLSLNLSADDTVGVAPARIDSLRNAALNLQDKAMNMMEDKWMTVSAEEDKLVEGGAYIVPVRLYKGDELKVVAGSTQKIKSVTVKEYKTGDLVASGANSQDVEISGKARVASIYLITVKVDKQCYIDLSILRKAGKTENLFASTNVHTSTVECSKGEKGAYAKQEVEMKNLFEEPFKATLASQGRALFGNKSKSMASVQLPKGSTGFFYRLRLSSSKDADHSDGELSSELISISSHRSFAGIEYSHNTKVTSPFVESVLSGLSSPKCEEEIYCNLYVIKGAKEARKFQDGSKYFVYNLDASKQNTQSTNGYVPSEGLTSFYMGLDNSRFTTSIYVWLDVVAVVPTTKYYKEVYE